MTERNSLVPIELKRSSRLALGAGLILELPRLSGAVEELGPIVVIEFQMARESTVDNRLLSWKLNQTGLTIKEWLVLSRSLGSQDATMFSNWKIRI